MYTLFALVCSKTGWLSLHTFKVVRCLLINQVIKLQLNHHLYNWLSDYMLVHQPV